MEINIIDIIEKNLDNLQKDFESNFVEIFKTYSSLSTRSQRSDLKSVYISFLHSSIQNNLPIFRIDLHDDKSFSEIQECWKYWNPSLINDFLGLSNKGRLFASSVIENKELAKNEIENLEKAKQVKKSLHSQIFYIVKSSMKHVDSSVTWYYGDYYGNQKEIE